MVKVLHFLRNRNLRRINRQIGDIREPNGISVIVLTIPEPAFRPAATPFYLLKTAFILKVFYSESQYSNS